MSATETRSSPLDALAEIGPRRAGSDAERRAAGILAEALAASGARPRIEPTYVHPQWSSVYLLHCLLALGGSLLSAQVPAAGFALVLLAATSLYLDLSGRFYLLRRLFFRRASQNVIAPALGESDRPRVILCAHYDSGRTGAAYNDWALRGFERVRRLWPAPVSPMAVVFWSMALLLPALGLRLAGIDANWVSILQLPQTLMLLLAAFMLGEISLSPTSPGANDGLSAPLAALRVLERLRPEPLANAQLHVLLTGAGETTQQGMREFLRSHRKELDKESTWFIDLDSAGRGTPRMVRREVPALAQPMDIDLLELGELLADADDARALLDLGPAGGASTAAAYGYRSAALTARPADEFVPIGHHTPADRIEQLDPDAIDGVAAFATDLLHLLDRDLGRRQRSA